MKNALLIWLASLLFSCVPDRQEALLPELIRAESLMYAYPDSALSILKSMTPPSASDKWQQAAYCLLLVQACDKNYVPHTSDSLIHIASTYFMKRNDPHRKALVLNYQGRVSQDLGEVEKATAFYLQARDMAAETDDYKLRFLIASNLGAVYLYNDLYEEALRYYKEANLFVLKTDDRGYASVSYSHLGRVFLMLKKCDSAIISYKRGLSIAEQKHDLVNTGRALKEISVVYSEIALYDSALVYLRKAASLNNKTQTGNLYQINLGLGSVYLKLGILDSAEYYLNKSLSTTNIYTKRAGYRDLSELYEKQNRYKEAIACNTLFLQMHDSIQQMDESVSIAEIHAKYNHEKLENEKNRLIIEKDRVVELSLCTLLFLLIIIICMRSVYHRKLLMKERALLQFHANEDKIRENEEQLQALSELLHVNSDTLEDQTIEIDRIRRENEKLCDKNDFLQKRIAGYTTQANGLHDLPAAYQLLSEKYKQVCLRERFLSDEIIRQHPLLSQLLEVPKFLTAEQWIEIEQTVNLLHDNFTIRLQKQFPVLTEDDIHLCCLIKLRLSNTIMATLTGVSPSSVTKRKQRMKEQMNQYLDTELAKNRSFDIWLQEY